jgi:sugar lactone lactonase YvrE
LYAVNTIPSQVFRYDPATGAQTGPNPFVSFNGQNDGHDVQGPQGMRFGPGGNLYIADVTLSNVHVYDPAGNSLGSIDGPSLSQPGDVAFDTTGNLPANNVFVANPATANILVSTGLGQPFVDFTAPIAGGLINPVSLSFGPDHDLYVLDVGGGEPKIIRFAPNATPDGTVVSFTGDNFFTPAYLAFGPDGNLYVSGLDFNTGAGQIRRYGTDGTPLGVLVDTGLANPTFMVFSVPEPSGLAMLGMGIFGIFLYRRRR